MDAGDKIAEQIRDALEADPRIGAYHHPLLIARNADGSVTLDGEVPNLAAKKLCLERAASVSGVGGIVDRVRVTPVERMGDGQIRDHVRDAILAEPAFNGYGIRVRIDQQFESIRETLRPRAASVEISVTAGVVTLNGTVESLSHKRLAGVMAWWVPGTRDVINGLEVDPPEADSDDEITEAMRIVLEKDPLVNEDTIRVSTRNSIVTLDGLAANEQVKRAAEADAWFTFGVDSVVNSLEIR